MLLSYRYRFLFLHIYKTGGVSIDNALLKYCYPPYESRWTNTLQRLGLKPSRDNLGVRHISWQAARERLGPARMNRLYTFATVRNPWDWLVSLYFYGLQNSKHRGELERQGVLPYYADFDTYIRWRTQERPKLQLDFLVDESYTLRVDHILYMERLQADFQALCDRLGLACPALPYANSSKHKPFYEYYTPELWQLVRQAYWPDIQTLGYDQPFPEPQAAGSPPDTAP
jgi:hypothetical protein